MSSRWDRMSPLAREHARDRNRRWREAHPGEDAARSKARRDANPDYYRAKNKEWYEANKDRHRALGRRFAEANPNIHVLYQHGIQPSELDALYEAQSGLCAICGEAAPKRGPGCLFIDHDHTSGERRGLICGSCNRALPAFERLGGAWALRALAYLGDPPLRRLRKEQAS